MVICGVLVRFGVLAGLGSSTDRYSLSLPPGIDDVYVDPMKEI